jgi:hypothetical protein
VINYKATRTASVNTAIPPATASLQNNPAGATTFGQISTPSSACSRQRPRRSRPRSVWRSSGHSEPSLIFQPFGNFSIL